MKKVVQILVVLLMMGSILFLLTACQSENKKDEENVVKNESEETVSQKDPEREKALEAVKLVNEYYPIAEALYFLSDEYFDIDKSEDANGYALKYPIRNYEEVIHQYLSEKLAEEFYPALLQIEDGNYYVGIGGFAEGYDNLRFHSIVIDEDKISCKVVLDLYVADELLEKDLSSDFVLVKEDGNWKIDQYTPFNLLRDNKE